MTLWDLKNCSLKKVGGAGGNTVLEMKPRLLPKALAEARHLKAGRCMIAMQQQFMTRLWLALNSCYNHIL